MDYYYYYVDGIKNNKRYVSKKPIELLAENLETALDSVTTLIEKHKFSKEDIHWLGSTTTKRYYELGTVNNPNKSLELKVIKKDVEVNYSLKHVDVLRYIDIKGTRRKINLTNNFKIVFMDPKELVGGDFMMFKLIDKDLKFVSFISEEEKERLQKGIEAWEELQKHNS